MGKATAEEDSPAQVTKVRIEPGQRFSCRHCQRNIEYAAEPPLNIQTMMILVALGAGGSSCRYHVTCYDAAGQPFGSPADQTADPCPKCAAGTDSPCSDCALGGYPDCPCPWNPASAAASARPRHARGAAMKVGQATVSSGKVRHT